MFMFIDHNVNEPQAQAEDEAEESISILADKPQELRSPLPGLSRYGTQQRGAEMSRLLALHKDMRALAIIVA
jgi:hypothetical protein